MKQIWLLTGHRIPNPHQAFAVFLSKPTKEQLLQTSRFNDNELDNKLIDCLLKYNICGTVDESKDFRYEYNLLNIDQGDLNLDDYLYTGSLDMRPQLLIKI